MIIMGDVVFLSKDFCVYVGGKLQGFLSDWEFPKVTSNGTTIIWHMGSHRYLILVSILPYTSIEVEFDPPYISRSISK